MRKAQTMLLPSAFIIRHKISRVQSSLKKGYNSSVETIRGELPAIVPWDEGSDGPGH